MRRDHMFLLGRTPGALLDIGCGNGTNLDRFRKLGWNVFGQEVDPKAAVVAATRGFPVFVGPLSALAPSCRFDAIIMNHVIEHIRDPLSLLVECRRLLKPSGVLVITTPNAAGLGAKMFGRYWRGYEVPRHLFVFAPASLATILKRSSLNCISQRTLALSAQSIFLESLAAVQATHSDRAKSFPFYGLIARALSLLYCAIAEVAIRISWTIGDEVLMICSLAESE
jgi:2-polyprenyl-3-methyl-5-hydroxy-6-metoxy-1,4-benzoquinol methylase